MKNIISNDRQISQLDRGRRQSTIKTLVGERSMIIKRSIDSLDNDQSVNNISRKKVDNTIDKL